MAFHEQADGHITYPEQAPIRTIPRPPGRARIRTVRRPRGLCAFERGRTSEKRRGLQA